MKVTDPYIAFALYGHYMACMAGWICFLMGPISDAWASSTYNTVRPYGSSIVGYYTMATGLVVLLSEMFHDLVYTKESFHYRNKINPRGVLYILLSGYAFASIPTAIGAAGLLGAGIAYTISARRGEVNDKDIGHTFTFVNRFDKKEEKKDKEHMEDKELSLFRDGLVAYIKGKYNDAIEQGKVGTYVFGIVYFSANIGYFLEHYFYYAQVVALQRKTTPTKALSSWLPFAKGGGALLNLNCIILVLPVLRSLLKVLNDGAVGGRLSFILKYVPLRLNLTFHMLIAKMVLFGGSLHIFCHFANFAYAPFILDTFGLTPWITGAFITIAMICIYSAAPEKVRRADFQLFWWNHHMFIIFFGCLFAHSTDQRVFLKFGALPILAYIYERISRTQRGNKPVLVQRIKYIHPVMEIRFAPQDPQFEFKEGQYVFLNCPYLSESQWHPFTVSSAYEDLGTQKFMSVHIRVQTKGGWTDRLKNYFDDMNPTGSYPFELYSLDKQTGAKTLGKTTGIDGKAFLRMDGPHAAPCQHYSSYKASIIVGAGIGLTPVASIMRATLLYKWKKGFNPDCLYFAWVVRADEIMSFQWFIALLQQLTEKVDFDRKAGSIKDHNYLEIHIYVTGHKNDTGAPIEPKDLVESGVEALATRLLNPTIASKNQSATMANPSTAANKYGDIWIWNGRPDWDQLFSKVVKGHAGLHANSPDIGVCFCGAPVIGKDLKKMCEKYSSSKAPQIYFKLHKENF
jgi:predicted ferric reductase